MKFPRKGDGGGPFSAWLKSPKVVCPLPLERLNGATNRLSSTMTSTGMPRSGSCIPVEANDRVPKGQGSVASTGLRRDGGPDSFCPKGPNPACPPSLHIETPRKAVRRPATRSLLARASPAVPVAEDIEQKARCPLSAMTKLGVPSAQLHAAKAAGLAADAVLAKSQADCASPTYAGQPARQSLNRRAL
jgi:hypothetical protein